MNRRWPPDFGLTGPVIFRCLPTEAALQSWTDLGLWWMSGRGLYRTTFEVAEGPGRIDLALGEVRECAEVWVNGALIDVRLWPPYRVEITEAVRPGTNTLVVIVANLLANRFAWDHWGTRGEGRTLDSGLLGPVTLEFRAP